MKEPLVLLVLIIFPATEVAATSSGLAISLPGCPDKCGNVSIPYPFGIGDRCAATSQSPFFTVTCNDSFQPPRPMVVVPTSAIEVIDISLERGEMRIYSDVSYYCFMSNTTVSDKNTFGSSLEGTPFITSTTRNRFTVISCNTLGIIGGYTHSSSDLYVAGCYSYCQGINSTTDGVPCTGMGCCETTISPNLTDFTAILFNESSVWNFNPCFYAMLVEVGWYSFRRQDLAGHLDFINERATRGVPVVSDWAIRNGTCPKSGAETPENYACELKQPLCECKQWAWLPVQLL
ncbi:hypothetical protein ACP4OV_022970 [Aristida adscensionis]